MNVIGCGKGKAIALVMIVFLVNLLCFSSRVEGGGSASSFPNFVWSDEGYPSYLVYEGELPLDVYVLSLSGVGNYRATNHSALVDGAMQACGFKEIMVHLDWEIIAKANMSIRAHIISSWDAYKMLIEWGSNVVVVNTHDEYLPVPSGYTREEWADKIADFMLNRWGTWVHTGGYPLYRVWHENGTVEEWGKGGFQQLMGHIGKGNITCYPPETDDWGVYTADGAGLFIGWWLRVSSDSHLFASFHYSNLGYPMDLKQLFEDDIVYAPIYEYKEYVPVAAIYFRPNQTQTSLGIYIHFTPWRFFEIEAGDAYSRDLADTFMGCASTAAAIWADVGTAIEKIYGRSFGEGAIYTIEKARRDGKTVGLDVAEDFIQKALDAFNSEEYKLAVFYAEEAKNAAEKATAPNNLPLAIATIAVITASVGIGSYYKIKNKKNNRSMRGRAG